MRRAFKHLIEMIEWLSMKKRDCKCEKNKERGEQIQER